MLIRLQKNTADAEVDARLDSKVKDISNVDVFAADDNIDVELNQKLISSYETYADEQQHDQQYENDLSLAKAISQYEYTLTALENESLNKAIKNSWVLFNEEHDYLTHSLNNCLGLCTSEKISLIMRFILDFIAIGKGKIYVWLSLFTTKQFKFSCDFC